MSTTLKPVLHALNLTQRDEQVAFAQLLQVSGAFGQLPIANGVASPQQAAAILDNVTFENNDEALQWLHVVTQQHFLRSPSGAERVHVHEPAFAKEHRDAILPLLEKTGLTASKSPVTKHFDHALVLGAMQGSVDARLDELKAQWDRGVRFDAIYLLGSKRPLIAEHESAAGPDARSESDMFLARYNEKSANWPEELKAVRTFIVDTPNGPDGHRANTQDTVKHWLKAGVTPGSVLAVSNQPYANYQDAAVRSALPAGFTLETAAPAANVADLKITNALDSFAREIDVGYAQLRERVAQQQVRAQHMEQVTMVDPTELKFDPARFQFRRAGNSVNGVTEHGKQRGEYNPLTHGDVLLLWENKQGERFVVDGHHRTAYLQTLRARGEGPQTVPSRILREADGYNALDAKIIGAYKNFIQDRKIDLLDAAAVFHEAQSGKAHLDLLPRLKLEGDLRVSYQASQLTDNAFDMVKRGEVPVETAARVAQNTAADQQAGALAAVKNTLAQQKSWVQRVETRTAAPGISL